MFFEKRLLVHRSDLLFSLLPGNPRRALDATDIKKTCGSCAFSLACLFGHDDVQLDMGTWDIEAAKRNTDCIPIRIRIFAMGSAFLNEWVKVPGECPRFGAESPVWKGNQVHLGDGLYVRLGEGRLSFP